MTEEGGAETKMGVKKCCARLKPDPALVPLKIFYFLQLGGISTLFLYIPLYMDQVLGLSKSEIAVTSFLAPFLSFFSRLLFGSLADRSQKFRLVILLVVIGNCCSFDLILTIPAATQPMSSELSVSSMNSSSLLLCSPSSENSTHSPSNLPHSLSNCRVTCPSQPALSLPLLSLSNSSMSSPSSCALYGSNFNASVLSAADNCSITCKKDPEHLRPVWGAAFWQAMVWRALGYFLYTPTLCLADTITMALLEPDRRKEYGGTRLFGSLGFFVFSLLTSAALRFWEGSLLPTFALYSTQTVLSIGALAAMRAPEGLRCSNSVGQSFRLLCISPEAQIFFLFAFLSGMCMAVVENYVFIAVKSILNPNGSFFGLMTACMVISETPVMAVSGYIIARLGELSCICLGFLFWALRFFVYSVMTQPWQVLLNELLHGLTFAVVFPALVTYGSRLAPPGTEGTMQGMISGVHLGLGTALGGLLGGVVFDWLGNRRFFVVCCCYSLVCALMLFLLQCFYLRRRQTSNANEYVVAITLEANSANQIENGTTCVSRGEDDN